MLKPQTITMATSIGASTKGLDEVEKARLKKRWSKAEQAWADLANTSVPTLKRFWAGIPIQVETFKKICEVVGITDWESIADFEKMDESAAKIYSKRLSFAIVGSLEEVDKHKLDTIVALLQKLGGDTTIEILDIDKGSINLILGGSPEALEKIEALFKSGDLDEVSGLLVQDVHFLEKQELILLVEKNGGTSLNLSGANLSGANLSGADLSVANLSGANLSRANLSGADLRVANLSGADLRVANLIEANLSQTYLIEANLRWVNLSGANLIEANLRGANLGGADLSEVNLSGANLSGANLIEANLNKTNVKGARFLQSTGIDRNQEIDLTERGAIFDSPPMDEASVLSPR